MCLWTLYLLAWYAGTLASVDACVPACVNVIILPGYKFACNLFLDPCVQA